ncbi:putative inactive poly [ADP-ribose] polymerase SRO2 [Gossypium australe]|uniref:Putative inactive poly [ADP-ribose] polymerase SRO2 n=1 Tax=Gossypium australe TaxID=47621 RepID=A0A5B6V0F8_9ROSI|nr:putative inactive poly [ADP-ribose] polymerase SRO2 [Gossypium australe]
MCYCYFLCFGSKGLTEPKTIKPKTWITFGTLISILSPFLDHSQRASLEEQYTNYLEKNITRPQMIQRVRAIAGNQLLSAVVKLYTNKEIQVSSTNRDDAAGSEFDDAARLLGTIYSSMMQPA